MHQEVNNPLPKIDSVVNHKLDVSALRAKQTGEGLTIGGQAQLIAITAERLRDQPDQRSSTRRCRARSTRGRSWSSLTPH